jgi:Flp pilus assembly protein TadG
VVEAALMLPWMIFLFVGVLDFGFYSYAAITTQNAARVAAVANAFSSGNATDSTGACALVIQEMNSLPNMRSVSSCSGTLSQTQPVSVTVPNTPPTIRGLPAAEVTVTYLSVPMIPIPGILMGQMTITKTVDVPILNAAP